LFLVIIYGIMARHSEEMLLSSSTPSKYLYSLAGEAKGPLISIAQILDMRLKNLWVEREQDGSGFWGENSQETYLTRSSLRHFKSSTGFCNAPFVGFKIITSLLLDGRVWAGESTNNIGAGEDQKQQGFVDKPPSSSWDFSR